MLNAKRPARSSKCSVYIPVELDEDEVPDLEHVGVILVDKVSDVATPSNAVVVKLSGGAARASVAHLPEVVLHASRNHLGEMKGIRVFGIVGVNACVVWGLDARWTAEGYWMRD